MSLNTYVEKIKYRIQIQYTFLHGIEWYNCVKYVNMWREFWQEFW